MGDSEDGSQINQAMEALPVFAAEAAYPACSRGERERNQEDEGREADGDERALADVLQHFVQIEEFIQPDVGKKMERRIEKCEETDHAADANQPILAGDAPQRRDGERDKQEDEGPVAGGMGDNFDWIRAKPVVKPLPCQTGQR